VSESSLGERAEEFAKQYVLLVEALVKEGVPEHVARNEARIAALTMVWQDEGAEGDECPLCGRGD